MHILLKSEKEIEGVLVVTHKEVETIDKIILKN